MRPLIAFFFKFDGRIARRQWWLGQIPLAIASIWVTYHFDPGLFDIDAPIAPPNAYDTAIQLALAVPTLALTSKRLNDRGWPRWVFGAASALFLALLIGPHFGFSDDLDRAGTFEIATALTMLAALLALIVDNGVLRGQTGANAYGPDPLARS